MPGVSDPTACLCWLILAVAGLLTAGCASHSRDLLKVRTALLAGDVEGAANAFEERSGDQDDLLYLLELGYMQHLRGQWEASNVTFELAEARADELFTRSITRNAAALVTSDNVLPYRGATYELQLVQYYRALNYLELGLPDDALVEARKANEQLSRFAADEEGGKTTYRQNPFLHYVTGMLYMSAGEMNDAIISLRDAYRLYGEGAGAGGLRAPPGLTRDYYAAAAHIGLHEEMRALRARHPELVPVAKERATAAEWKTAATPPGRLVVFFESGFVPFREPVDIVLPFFEDDDGIDTWARAATYVNTYGSTIYDHHGRHLTLDHVLRFSFPRLVDSPSAITHCELLPTGGGRVSAVPGIDLEAVAGAEFKDRMPGILLRTLVRALIKETARAKTEKEQEALGVLVNIFNLATEQADTRGWIFLPRRIDVGIIELPPGSQQLVARFAGAGGGTVEEFDLTLELAPGETQFVTLRSFQ